MSDKKQTSVDWIISKLPMVNDNDPYLSELIHQAKEMEKQQIIDAYNENENYMCSGTEGEQYYQETYKNQ